MPALNALQAVFVLLSISNVLSAPLRLASTTIDNASPDITTPVKDVSPENTLPADENKLIHSVTKPWGTLSLYSPKKTSGATKVAPYIQIETIRDKLYTTVGGDVPLITKLIAPKDKETTAAPSKEIGSTMIEKVTGSIAPGKVNTSTATGKLTLVPQTSQVLKVVANWLKGVQRPKGGANVS